MDFALRLRFLFLTFFLCVCELYWGIWLKCIQIFYNCVKGSDENVFKKFLLSVEKTLSLNTLANIKTFTSRLFSPLGVYAEVTILNVKTDLTHIRIEKILVRFHVAWTCYSRVGEQRPWTAACA